MFNKVPLRTPNYTKKIWPRKVTIPPNAQICWRLTSPLLNYVMTISLWGNFRIYVWGEGLNHEGFFQDSWALNPSQQAWRTRGQQREWGHTWAWWLAAGGGGVRNGVGSVGNSEYCSRKGKHFVLQEGGECTVKLFIYLKKYENLIFETHSCWFLPAPRKKVRDKGRVNIFSFFLGAKRAIKSLAGGGYDTLPPNAHVWVGGHRWGQSPST